MSNGLTIDVDRSTLLEAIDRLPVSIAARVKTVAHESAMEVKREAEARVARRKPPLTKAQQGRRPIEEGVVVEETHAGDGYVVYVQNPGMPSLDIWLEFGTRHMTARPFLFPAAALVAPGHERRVQQAIVDAIAAEGLGS